MNGLWGTYFKVVLRAELRGLSVNCVEIFKPVGDEFVKIFKIAVVNPLAQSVQKLLSVLTEAFLVFN